LQNLRYPTACDGTSVDWQSVAAGFRGAPLAEALSAVVSEEFAELERAWGLNSASAGEGQLEQVVTSCLKKMAKRAEHACVVKALAAPLPLAPSKQPSADLGDLEARCKRLEEDAGAARERLADLRIAARHEGALGLRSVRQIL